MILPVIMILPLGDIVIHDRNAAVPIFHTSY